MIRRSTRNLIILVALGLIAAIVVAVRLTGDEPIVRLSVGTGSMVESEWGRLPAGASWPYSARLIADWNLDTQHSFQLKLIPRVTGKGALASLLDGNADIAAVSAAPIVAAVSKGVDVVVLARTESSTRQIRLVTSRDHVDDWLRYPISYIPGTTMESLLDTVLADRGYPKPTESADLKLTPSVSPTTQLSALLSGTATTSVLLLPQAATLTYAAPDSTTPSHWVDITPQNGYRFDNFIVTTRARWTANRDAILAATAAFRESRNLVRKDPERRLRELHNDEAGQSPLVDKKPYFWTEDELLFDTDIGTIRSALTKEAKLMLTAGRIAAVPSLEKALDAVDVVKHQPES